MSSITKNKLLGAVIITLVIINTLVLLFILLKKDQPPHELPGPKGPPRDLIAEQLGFSPEQKDAFFILKKEHAGLNDDFRRQIKEKREQLFAEIKNGNDSLADALASEIGSLHKKMEINNYLHFKKVRAICHEDQLEGFDRLVQEIPKHMGPPPGHRRGPEGEPGPPPPGPMNDDRPPMPPPGE